MQKNMDTLEQAIETLINTAYDAERGSSYHLVLANIFRVLYEIESLELAGLSKEKITKRVQKARDFIADSPFYHRLQTWPRGYQGDFETVEYLMDAKNQAEPNTAAYLLENYGMVSPAAQQHRNKLAYQSHLVASAYRTKQLEGGKPGKGGKLRVLSIACGSCPDLRQAEHYIDAENCEFVLIDGDKDALDYAALRMSGLDQSCEFICDNIIKQLKPLAKQENFDLIITGGLFDYLGEKSIIKIINQLYQDCLNTGGKFFFTNISPENIDRLWIEYLCNWHLLARTEAQLRQLAEQAEVEAHQIKIKKDQTGLTYFVELFK